MIGKPTHKNDKQGKADMKIELLTDFTFIPSNRLGVTPGYYTAGDIVKLLREVYRGRFDSRPLLFILDTFME